MVEVGSSRAEVMRVRVISDPAPSDIAKNLLNLPFWFQILATFFSTVILPARNTANQWQFNIDSIH
jgi:hypothetical protein